MKIAADGLPIFEDVECWDCHGVGTVQRNEPCANAGQTFRKGCPLCGATRKAEHKYHPKANRDECYTCKGVGSYRETRFDSDKANFWRTLPIRILRSDRPQMWSEANLGHGLVSVTDYGRYKVLTDEQFIAKVHEDCASPQYCTYVNASGIVADAIVVACNDNGYTVIAVWETK